MGAGEAQVCEWLDWVFAVIKARTQSQFCEADLATGGTGEREGRKSWGRGKEGRGRERKKRKKRARRGQEEDKKRKGRGRKRGEKKHRRRLCNVS